MLFAIPASTPISSLPIAPKPEGNWYGPATVTIPTTFPGNPYDPTTNDVRAIFVGADGTRHERLAFFDGESWRATLAAPKPGRYTVGVLRNGTGVNVDVAPVTLTKRLAGAYVRRGGKWGFVMGDGKPYWPVGYNVAWKNDEVPDVAAEIRKMGANGANWSRVWTSFWDGKAAYFTKEFVNEGTIDHRAWIQWDPIVRAAEEAGVPFQFCLFHHGPWSSTTNTNWPDSPWRKANGGILENPEDFFTDPRAKALTKAVLRYTVAKYAHSPGIMAWEIFNEVQWTDGLKKDPENVGRWHDEMARYLRECDPYDHLVVTSSDLDLPIWRESDAYEPHAYPPVVGPYVLAANVLKDKPFFFGEVGPGELMGGKALQVEAIRGGIWNALFSGHAGAAQFWTWDLVARDDLRPEYRRARAILDRSGAIARGPLPRKILDLRAGSGADLTVIPGGGWGKSPRAAFSLPADAPAVAGLSNYIQGDGNRTLMPEAPTFTFTADRAGEVRVRVSEASANRGGSLELKLDGASVVRKAYAPGPQKEETLVAAFGPGTHTLALVNDGADWVRLGGITFTGIGPVATAAGMADARFGMVRVLRRDAGTRALAVSLADLGMTGRVAVEVNDLDTGTSRRATLDAGKGRLSLTERDAVIVLRKG